ncbi:MAG TPA: hypothetical protein VEH08_04235 [Methanomassiliicoccales archaeon]|nr:hypothetical protein [Methanomassiliicoccales archaeon]
MAQNKNEEAITLTRGSRYRVISRGSGPEPIVTVGVFKGYASFGHDTALTMEVQGSEGENPILRLLPCLAVLSVDVLEFKPEDKAKEKTEADTYIG